MKCSNCGAIVLKTDTVCKKCGTPQHTVEKHYADNVNYRSRFGLLFYVWIGGWRGSHLKFLGFEEDAERMRQSHKIGFFSVMTPAGWLEIVVSMAVQVLECTKVIFGAYRTDVNGNPVRYLKPRSK